jgi:hypothetical protein
MGATGTPRSPCQAPRVAATTGLEIIKNIGTVLENQTDKAAAAHAADFEPPIGP